MAIKYSLLKSFPASPGIDSSADIPLTNNVIGDQLYVAETNRLYIWNGSGWYNIALINTAPTITNGANASYILATDGTPTVITLTATDPEGIPITWSYAVTSGSLGSTATITQADNVFTITPSTNTADGGTFGITFTASDGVNTATSTTSITLAFVSAYWDETVLSIGTNSTDALANSTFVDRSTNARTVTNNGTPAQTSFHPYLENWSVYFPSGAYSYIPASNTYGTNDFCLEAWIYPISINTFIPVITQWNNGSNQYGFHVPSDRTLMFYVGNYGSGQGWRVTAETINLNEWSHIAVTRESNVWRFFINGVEYATTTYSEGTVTWSDSRDFNNTTHDIGIGGVTNYTGSLFYLSNVRIVRGSAVYTTNFTPSDEKLTDITNTRFLGCQSNRFIDNSSIENTWSPTNAVISSLNPFGQESEYASGENKGSVVLEGSTSYLKFPVTSFTGDYTLECWVYKRDSDKAQVWGAVYPTDGNFQWFIETNNKLDIYPGSIPSTSTIKLNAWNHIVFQRRSGTLEYFINGVKDATTSSGDTTSRNLSSVGGSGLGQLDGYVADARATIGSAVYTENFTPPTSPVGNTPAYVYIPMDNAGIFDKTGNRNITVIGADTYTDTSITKYSTSSIAYRGVDNNSSGLLVPSSTIAGLGDWTIEFWVYHTDVTPGHSIVYVDARNGGANDSRTPGIYLFESSGNYVLGYYANTAYQIQSTNNPFSVNTWYHIAVCRSSGSTKMFIDGSQVGSTYSDTIDYVAQPMYVGRRYISVGTAPTYYGTLPGNIENFQILNGVAKYTANFTPPAAEQGRTYQAES